ncbi:MAG: arsenic resistance N-acetyltransferase ArsN2 [Rhodospirillum sp.]|nr:arsenic resistance N-acetyltransferase ArsN2 [Rhodospirillum sp.]MCF8489508.1 arsenic resistance N-acetyltransferase ArsN2 [Rhodospirillum sp.]MCF8500563.1 arsenic resistance N-acetyltransferase ArsN2 [Rhodospirillum sp.]
MTRFFHPAEPSDRPAVEALLTASALPVSDLPADLDGFLILLDGDVLAACGGVEPLDGTTGLVRSLVVAPPLRGQGIADALLTSLEALARKRGLTTLCMLTTTIAAFAKARGFIPTSRAAAPLAIQTTAQFQGLCPDSATLLIKALPRT